MSGIVLLFLGLVPQDHHQRALEEAEAGRLGSAWAEMLAETDRARQLRARTEILYRAGDPAGALQAAEQGLEHAPADLELLHRGCSAALWLQDGERAADLALRLQQAVLGAELLPEHRRVWEEASLSLREAAGELVQRDSLRERAFRRARWTAAAVLAIAVLALFGLSARRW